MCYIGKFSLCTFGTGILIVGKIDSATECKLNKLIATLSHNSDFYPRKSDFFPHNFEFKSHNFYLAEKKLTLFRYKTQSCKMKKPDL